MSARTGRVKVMCRRSVGASVVAASTLAFLTSQLAGAAAAPPEPSYAAATIDGSAAEWNAGDQWGTIVSNDPPMRTVASASLRYDCATNVLSVLVLASPGEKLQTADPAEAYVRIGTSGKLVSGLSNHDGTPPDFAWVDQADGTARGFEASASLAPGAYPLRIHAKLPDDSADGYETTDLNPRYSDLLVACVAEEQVTSTTQSTTTDPSTTTSDPSTTTALGPVRVTATTVPPTDPGRVANVTLARTGTSSGPLAAVGAGLVLVGAFLVRRARCLAT